MLNVEQRNKIEVEAIKAMLIINEVFDDAILFDNLTDLFRADLHKQIVSEIYKQFVKTGKKPTPNDMLILLPKDLRSYFVSNISTLTTFGNEKYFAKLHGDNLEAETRDLIRDCETLKYAGKEYTETIYRGIIEIMQKAINPVKEETNEERIERIIMQVEKARKGEKTKFIKTGYVNIDNKIGGLQRKNISVVAARPGQGKTTFALNLKERLNAQGYGVLFFSIEMDAESLSYKDLSYMSEIDSVNIEKGELTDDEMRKIHKTAERMKRTNYIYIDNPKQDAQTIISRIKREQLRNKIDVVMIDYLTLISLAEAKTKTEAVGNMLNELKAFIKESNIALVLLSQLNRKVEERGDKKPVLSDLRDSGEIEQIASQILFLFRPAYYFNSGTIDDENIYGEDGKLRYENLLEVIIAKARGASTGTALLEYLLPIQKINNTYDSRTDKNMSDLIERNLPI